MASQYAHTINEKRYNLIDQLVVKLLQVERGHENFELARDFCVQKAWFNSFPDVNPRETEEVYAGLVARLEADSQLTKASALSALTNKLLALKLTSTAGVLDLNHNLLQLLASLSDNPLSSRLNLTQDVLDLLYNPADRLAAEAQQQQQQQQQQGQEVLEQPAGNAHFQRLLRDSAGRAVVRHDADSAPSSDDYDPYGDDSSLSDWGEADSTQQQQQQQQWGLQTSKESEHGSDEQEQPQDEQQLVTPEGDPGQPHAPAVADIPAATYVSRTVADQLPHGCVVPAPGQPLLKLKALHARSGRAHTAAAQQPQQQQQLCLSEHFLAQQVLRVLQGLPAQGFRIIYPAEDQAQELHGSGVPQPVDHSAGADDSSTVTKTSSSSSTSCEQYFKVNKHVSTPHMPSCALHAVLAEAAAAGTCSRQMRALIQQLAYSSLIGSRVEVTPCLRALGVALQQQLDSLGMQLADLQQQLQQEHTQRANATSSSSSTGLHSSSQPQQQQGERGLLIRYFLREARPIVRRLKLLHSTVFGILRGLHGPPAAVSAALIDGLAAAVQAASCEQASCPQAVAGAAALLHLLLSSCVPLSRALAQWLWCAEDTVTAPGKWGPNGRSVCSSDFFIIKTAEEDVPAVHPSFWHNAYSFSRQVSASSDDHNHPDGLRARAGAAGPGKGAAPAAAAPISCPAVLAPFAHSIMTAGKSMRLLDHMDQEDLKRSSLCSGSGVGALGVQAPGLSIAASVGQQQQGAPGRPGSAAAGGGGGGGAWQQQQPGTPRRRRLSSCGGRVTSSSTAGTGVGRLTRQPSWSVRPGSSRPASASAAALAQGQAAIDSRGRSRKKWEAPQQSTAAAPAAGALSGTALTAVCGVDRSAIARRVELQLAAAAAVAGQQLVENELPHDFIGSVNYVLQQEQELQAKAHATMQQHKQYLQTCTGSTPGSGSSSSSSSATELLLQRLETVAASLAKPNDLAAAGAAVGAAAGAPVGGQLSLREALWAARKAREAGAGAALLHEAAQAGQDTTAQQHLVLQQSPAESGPEVAATAGATGSSSSSSSSVQQIEGGLAGPPAKGPGSPAAPEPQTPPKVVGPVAAAESPTECFSVQLEDPEAADTEAGAAAAAAEQAGTSSGSSSPDVVPKLTVWKDRMDAKLTAAHQHLQRMAPWQQQVPADSLAEDTCKQADKQQQQSGSKATSNTVGSSSRSCKNWLLSTADTKVPGQFTGSLAELWPLKPVRGLKDLAASGASWLQGAAWPGCDLEWLLHDPPGHLPAVQQLLWSALVQPVRTRVELVDRQLLSSLMGEWGMLQQLQGLANAFLITSPSMVEWVDALFTAVETHWKTRPVSSSLHSRHGGECSTPTSTSKTTPRIGGAGGYDSPGVYVGSPGGLPGTGGQTPVTVEDLDFSALEALLQDCLLSADPDEVLPDPTALLITLNKPAINSLRDGQQRKLRALAEAGPAAAARQQPAVGLMLCSKEWAGLELQHTGSWQLSLVYTDEQLRFFGQAWRVMLQLRWVRRRVGAQAVAHRVSASVNDLAARDRLEAAQVAAAFASGSRTRPHSAGSYGQQPTAAAVLDWLSGKEELLLLQEMNHFLSCWHSYVMDGIRVKAWDSLEEVLRSAKSLDQVHSATRSFFQDMCSFCNLWPPTLQRTRKAKMPDTTRHQIEELMDHALAAAAAAGRVFAARHKLRELQGAPGRESDMQAWWMELAEARSRLRQAGRLWQKGLSDMLQFWTLMKKHNVSHAFEELPALLDMNGYFSRVDDAARS